MPCRVDGPLTPQEEANAKIREERKRADKLTHENDMLRESILALVNDRDAVLPMEVKKIIEHEQMLHRKEDLKRLEATFRRLKSATNLGKVILADPTKPLEPQLGFDPDVY